MSQAVTLRFVAGSMKGKAITFTQPTTYTLGRGLDCDLVFPDTEANQHLSRSHCRFDVNPPHITVTDLGSLNGTWVNGREIGRREAEAVSGPQASPGRPEELKEKDEVRLGPVVLSVQISNALLCASCGLRLDETSRSGSDSENIMCPDCRASENKTMPIRSESGDKAEEIHCAACGRTLSAQASYDGQEAFLCSSCRDEAGTIIKALLERAAQGEPGLKGLFGLELVRSLGQGASGAAFLARKTQTGEELALKIMLPEVALNKYARDMFLREVANAGLLDHPNVVKLYDSGSYKGVFFYSMDYCDAGSLDGLLAASGGKLPLEEALRLNFQILDGLDYIHNVRIQSIKLADGATGEGRGLVHRDIKPANIFLSGQGPKRIAKIADVGVGKAFDTAGLSGHTRTGSVAGSPVTMPRQQVINFKFARPEVDVWAAAATFYHMLTGKYPRDFSPDLDPCLVVLRSPAVPIAKRGVDIPPRLGRVVDQALIDKPEITFKTAADFKKALEEAL